MVSSSMIDFGDSQFNPIIYELGMAIMYLMTNCTEIHPNEVSKLNRLVKSSKLNQLIAAV